MSRLRQFGKKVLPAPARRAARRVHTFASIGIPAMYRHMFFGDTSQFGEVSACRRLIRPDWPKYIVEVGAFDGYHLSNSYPFIQEGWEAVLVEPHPGNFTRMKARFAANPKVHCIQQACSNISGTLPLFLEKGREERGGYSATLSTDKNAFMDQVRSEKFIEVPVDTLSNILSQCGAPQDMGLLSIDTEGVDFEVFEGLDTARFRPRLIITEEYKWEPAKHERKYALLRERGYSFSCLVGCNSIWIANELK